MRVHCDALEFQAIEEDSWRLCDTCVGAQDASSLIAYVERTGRGFEVVWLQRTCAPTTFDSLDAVLRCVRDREAADHRVLLT